MYGCYQYHKSLGGDKVDNVEEMLNKESAQLLQYLVKVLIVQQNIQAPSPMTNLMLADLLAFGLCLSNNFSGTFSEMSVRNLSVFQLLYHRNVSELCIWLPNCCCLAAFIDGRLIDTLACLL